MQAPAIFSLLCLIASASCQAVAKPFFLKLRVTGDRDFRELVDGSKESVKTKIGYVNKYLAPANVYIQLTGVDFDASLSGEKYSNLVQYHKDLVEHDLRITKPAYDFMQYWTATRMGGQITAVAKASTYCHPNATSLIPILDANGQVFREIETEDLIIWSLLFNMGITGQSISCDCGNCPANYPRTDVCWIDEKIQKIILHPCVGHRVQEQVRGRECGSRVIDPGESAFPICGNGILESGEECDCIITDDECMRCCNSVCKIDQSCPETTDQVTPVSTTTTAAPATKITKPVTEVTSTTAAQVKEEQDFMEKHRTAIIAGLGSSIVLIAILILVVVCVVVRKGRGRKKRSDY